MFITICMKVLNFFISSSSLKILGTFAVTPAGKVTTAAGLGGGGLLTLIFALHTSAMTEIKTQDDKQTTARMEMKKYVVEKIKDRDDVFKVHVKAFSDKQDVTNTRLETLTTHILNNK